MLTRPGSAPLVGAYASHQKQRHTVGLVGVNERVRNLFKVTHVEPFFQFLDSLPAAQTAPNP